MDENTSRAILALIAIAGVFGNMIAFLVARAELQGQREESRKLAHLTSELEHKVQRLNVALDQRVNRLHHAIELLSQVQRVLTDAYYRFQDGDITAETARNSLVEARVCMSELAALAMIIGDQTLENQVIALVETFGTNNPTSEKVEWLGEGFKKFSVQVVPIYAHLHRLLDSVTK